MKFLKLKICKLLTVTAFVCLLSPSAAKAHRRLPHAIRTQVARLVAPEFPHLSAPLDHPNSWLSDSHVILSPDTPLRTR